MIIGPSDNDKSAVLSAVFKNPHCALCNGVPLQNTTCWLKSRLRTISKARGHVPSFSIIMDFTFWEDENQELRWDVATYFKDALRKIRMFRDFLAYLIMFLNDYVAKCGLHVNDKLRKMTNNVAIILRYYTWILVQWLRKPRKDNVEVWM